METTPQELEEAHKALSADRAFQFDLPVPDPALPQPDPPPDWLVAILNFIGNLFSALGPILMYLLIGGVVLLIGYILFSMARAAYERRYDVKDMLKRKSKENALDSIDVRPEEKFARDLLAEADRLASEGRFREAVRLLLHSSIQDMQARVQQRIGISFTAREIGELGSMPVSARGALRRIIHSVEVSVFGGSDIGAEDYRFARSDYSEFAFGETVK